MAKIILTFKTDDNTDANNYRPISLLSNFDRIFEKLMFNRMESFIEKKNLFSPSQYGIMNKWFSSCLEGRTQTSQIGSFISPEKNITFNVP